MRPLTQVNLNSLKVVESAARHGNFTRAGEEQFITASAVSQRIKSLEDQLRFKIFRRGGNAVSLTPEGEAYVAQVREALERILAAGMEATGQSREHLLKISVLPTFAARWLFPRMPVFQAQHPEIQMRISTSYDTHDFLTSGLDVEIRYGDGAFPRLQRRAAVQGGLTPVCSAKLFHLVWQQTALQGRPGDLTSSRCTPKPARRAAVMAQFAGAGCPRRSAGRLFRSLHDVLRGGRIRHELPANCSCDGDIAQPAGAAAVHQPIPPDGISSTPRETSSAAGSRCSRSG